MFVFGIRYQVLSAQIEKTFIYVLGNFEKLRKQNPKLVDANIKFMGKYETKIGNKTLFNLKTEN